MNTVTSWRSSLLLYVAVAFSALLSGIASFIFLESLDWVTQFRVSHSFLIWLLPVAGLIVGVLYHSLSQASENGNKLVMQRIHGSDSPLPTLMAPLVYLGTIISHLFGASVGREGTALQMSGSIAERFVRPLRIEKKNTPILLSSAIAAGFSAVFGTPITGIVFALEVFCPKEHFRKSILACTLASIISNFTCHILGSAHTLYYSNDISLFSIKLLFSCICIGIASGGLALLFKFVQNTTSNIFEKISYPPLRPFIGAIILLPFFALFNCQHLQGLGIPIIQESFHSSFTLDTPLFKLLITAFCLGVGFKGGEVTPLFYIGASLGSSLAIFLPIQLSIAAALGFVSVFAGAAHAPIACTILCAEIFGISTFPYALISCLVAYSLSGGRHIYLSNEVQNHSHNFLGKHWMQKYIHL